MHPLKKIALPFLLCLSSANLSAEESIAIKGNGELAHLIEKALERSPEIELMQGQAESIRAEEAHLSIWENPEIRLGYGRDVNTSSELRSSRYPSHEYDATLRIFPKNPWELRAHRDKLQSATRLAELTQQDTANTISTDIKMLYWKFCYNQSLAELYATLLSMREQQNRGMEALLESGQVTLEQSLPAKMRQIESALEFEAVKQHERELLGELSRLTGVDKAAIRGQKVEAVSASSFDLPTESWQTLAVENRLEMDQRDSEIEYTKADLRMIEASDMLWFEHIQGNYQIRSDYGDRDSFGVEVAFSLPFFSTRDGRKEMASALLTSQQRARFYEMKMIESEVTNLVDAFNDLEKHWSTHHREMTPMINTLRTSLEQIEQSGVQQTQSYWNAKIGLVELEIATLELSWRYLQLRLLAESVIGQDGETKQPIKESLE